MGSGRSGFRMAFWAGVGGMLACAGGSDGVRNTEVKRGFTLAMVQMLVEGGRMESNLTRAESRIREAARHGAAVALLPELVDLGWTHPSALDRAEPIPDGAAARRLMRAAAKNRIYVDVQTVPRPGRGTDWQRLAGGREENRR